MTKSPYLRPKILASLLTVVLLGPGPGHATSGATAVQPGTTLRDNGDQVEGLMAWLETSDTAREISPIAGGAPLAPAGIDVDDDDGLTLKTVRGPRYLIDAEGYVPTPFGRLHSSCVYQVPNGSVIKNNEVRLDGRLIATLPPCPYERKPKQAPTSGERAVAAQAATNWGTADFTFAHPNAFGQDWYGAMETEWIVPPNPTARANQLVYLFNALMPADGSQIIQPVLQFGISPVGGAARGWRMASWHVIGTRIAAASPLMRVSSGDRVKGTLLPRLCTSAGTCTWDIISRFFDDRDFRTISAVPSQKMRYAFKGVLEAQVTDCDQLPPRARFTNTVLFEPQSAANPNAQEVATTETWTTIRYQSVAGNCVGRMIDDTPGRSFEYSIKSNRCSCIQLPIGALCSATPPGTNECWPGRIARCNPRQGIPSGCGGCACN